MTRARHRCGACARPLTAKRSRPCVRDCGARLCRAHHQPPCTDLHGGQCPNLQLPDEETPMTEAPTTQDVLNVAAAIDLFAADAAIEDALRDRPLTPDEQRAEALYREIRAAGDPDKIRQADFLMDAYKLRAFRGDA